MVYISIKLRFGSWTFFRLQVKKKEARVLVLPFYLKMEEDPASETL
jgi:hypothetical protein